MPSITDYTSITVFPTYNIAGKVNSDLLFRYASANFLFYGPCINAEV